MDILITGGAGFIGSASALALARRGHAVTVLDSFSEQVHGADRGNSFTWQSIRDRVALIEGDVRNLALLEQHMPRFDAVLHLAAETGTGQSMYDVARYCDVNVNGTAALLQVLVANRGKMRNLVIASSRAVYGEGRYECPVHGSVYPHARSVQDMEGGTFDCRCPACHEVVQFRSTAEEAMLRPASVYAITSSRRSSSRWAGTAEGAGFAATALALPERLRRRSVSRQPIHRHPAIFSRGDARWTATPRSSRTACCKAATFVHVEDVSCQGQRRGAGGAAAGNRVLRATSAAAVATSAADRCRQTLAAPAYGQDARLRISGRFRAGDIRHNCADIERLVSAVGFAPTIGFEQGMARFSSWVRSELSKLGAAKTYGDAMSELEARGLMKRTRPGA